MVFFRQTVNNQENKPLGCQTVTEGKNQLKKKITVPVPDPENEKKNTKN